MMLAGDLRLGAAIAQRRGVTKWVSGSMVQCVPVVRQNRNHLKLPLLPIQPERQMAVEGENRRVSSRTASIRPMNHERDGASSIGRLRDGSMPWQRARE